MKSHFGINDKVVHKREGLAQIVSSAFICEKPYFLLKACRGDGEMIYVPEETCDDIIRKIMDEKEAQALLKFMSKVEKDYTTNTKQRRDLYKRLLASGDVNDIAFLVMQLRIHDIMTAEQAESEMKLGAMDLDMLGKADDILMDEFAITFKKDRNKIKDFIFKKIKR